MNCSGSVVGVVIAAVHWSDARVKASVMGGVVGLGLWRMVWVW